MSLHDDFPIYYTPSRAKHYGPPSAMSGPAGEKSQAARRHGNRQHHQVKGPADWNDAAKRGKGGKEEGQRETVNEAQQRSTQRRVFDQPPMRVSQRPCHKPLHYGSGAGRPTPSSCNLLKWHPRWGRPAARHLCQRPNLSETRMSRPASGRSEEHTSEI